jgi:LmbE family N-acetylglucosaminyl deacetylase
MSKQKYSLICVAHPDDETIFFGGLLLRRRRHPWRVVCLTDGNADGQGKKRRRQFEKAAELLGVKEAHWWGYPDIYEKRLPVAEISARLEDMAKERMPHEVFTHGIAGEYGHPHHQDVSFAVHEAFRGQTPVHSVAYNAFPDVVVNLTEEEYALKTRILTEVYGSETSRFLHLLPATWSEGFCDLDPKEVHALYDFFAREKPLRAKDLSRHLWLAGHLKKNRNRNRPF